MLRPAPRVPHADLFATSTAVNHGILWSALDARQGTFASTGRLVAILDADSVTVFTDFRASERSRLQSSRSAVDTPRNPDELLIQTPGRSPLLVETLRLTALTPPELGLWRAFPRTKKYSPFMPHRPLLRWALNQAGRTFLAVGTCRTHQCSSRWDRVEVCSGRLPPWNDAAGTTTA